MSLILRKKSQELLDAVDLDNYHIQIDEGSKCLQIVGECGQSLCTISGIRMSRMAPNETEITLALELLDAFLAKHASAFKGFQAAKNRENKARIPRSVPLPNSDVSKGSWGDDYTLRFPLASDSNVSVEVNNSGTLTFPMRKILVPGSTKDELQATLTDTEYDVIVAWVDECFEYSDAVRERQEIVTKLNSCEI